MRSHFRISNSAVAVCAVSSATALLTGVCSAQVASDSASNPTYSGGWSAGQNGGTGFGAWSFNNTDPTPPGTYQGISTSSALGTSWSILSYSTSTGLGNAGRAINGGLQAGQMYQVTLQNPSVNAGNYTYRGFDILFTSGTDNNAGGNNAAALRVSVFDYFNPSMNWKVDDTSSHATGVSAITTGASASVLDLTLNTATTYTLTLAPLSNPNNPYFTVSGTLATPINYVDFRNYGNPSGGLTDYANNLNIGGMQVINVPEPSALALTGLGAVSFMLFRRRK